MQESYMSMVTDQEYCEWFWFSSVRNRGWVVNVLVKNLVWETSEEALSKIINNKTYNEKRVIIVYSSGHVFINEDRKQVYLVTTEKKWKRQVQFTWWSPLEEDYKNVIIKKKLVYNFDLKKVRKNAVTRTKNRTGVEVLEDYNDKPIVDWVLIETKEENWEIYYKLVCLMHFIVKKYEWILWSTWQEYTKAWDWYIIDYLPNIINIAPNAFLVSKKAVELVELLEEV